MQPEAYKDWRELMHGYLHACWEDARTGLDSQLLRSEERFLAEHGSRQLREAREKAATMRCGALREPPPKESYEVIEESANRVVGRFPVRNAITRMSIRFPL